MQNAGDIDCDDDPVRDRKQFERIGKLVRSKALAFQSAGASLDDFPHGYSDAALRYRESRRQRVYHGMGRVRRQPYTCTRAAWRKLYGEHGVPDGGERWKGAEGRLHRVPQPKSERFQVAWRETRDQLRQRPLDKRVAADQHAMAKHILMLIWLLTDPDADGFRPVLTEFQSWPWQGDLSVLSHDEGPGVERWSPDGAPIPTADFLVTRYEMFQKLLDESHDREQWIVLAGRAMDVVGSETDATATACGGPTEPESRDSEGFIVTPVDSSAFVGRAEVMKHTPAQIAKTDRRLAKVLEENRGTIRQYKPFRNRHQVHFMDWMAYVESVKPDDGDGWASPDEVEANKAAAHASKQHGK